MKHGALKHVEFARFCGGRGLGGLGGGRRKCFMGLCVACDIMT